MGDFAGAKAAIRQRLIDNWTETPITFQNEPTPTPWPPKDADGFPTGFVNLELSTQPASMRGAGQPGSQVWINPGFIYVHVFEPSGTGEAAATQRATAIGEIFRGKVFYETGDGCYVRTWAPRVDGGGSGSDDGNWFRVTMSVPFAYWHLG
ncbi:phage tail terminator-like protein [Devosia sp.]|uniref:phage tail terminator-like protein n=1 Tax=Devosia sp. TaxID=1871048 RepID=UPI001ACDD6C5|nr:phage tail terminator-like protein [Devosia sp.]MBN9334835.1 hypothetical protein [Devosia sp.]